MLCKSVCVTAQTHQNLSALLFSSNFSPFYCCPCSFMKWPEDKHKCFSQVETFSTYADASSPQFQLPSANLHLFMPSHIFALTLCAVLRSLKLTLLSVWTHLSVCDGSTCPYSTIMSKICWNNPLYPKRHTDSLCALLLSLYVCKQTLLCIQAVQGYFVFLYSKQDWKEVFRNKNNSSASDSAFISFLWMTGWDFCAGCCLSLISCLASLFPVWKAGMCHCVTGGG